MITLAVFDMAGTTINDGGGVYDALRIAVEETGATVSPADLQLWMGTEKRAAITALIELGGGDPHEADDTIDRAFARFLELLDEIYTAHPPTPIAGAPEAIAALRASGVKVALTTGFSVDVATGILEKLGWVVGGAEGEGSLQIDALVCGDEVAQGRPAPYMIHRAMERVGVLNVAELVVAGDTAVDVQAGANSGAAITIGVLSGKLDRDAFDGEPYTALLGSVAEIPAYLADRV